MEQTLKAKEPWYHNRSYVATAIALAFHISGFIAIGMFRSPLFISLTPLNLLVGLALILYTQQQLSVPFWMFCIASFGIGFASELLGVNTGLLFGEYSYGKVLGPGWKGVPWLIGVQWMVTMYCIGVSMDMLHRRLMTNQGELYGRFPRWWMALSTVADGALLAVLFDWALEPVAVQLGYWQWQNGTIPFKNYWSWWLVSLLILAIFRWLPFRKHNLFAIHLLLIQFMFFLLLRTFMK
jgi:putative membrane protein